MPYHLRLVKKGERRSCLASTMDDPWELAIERSRKLVDEARRLRRIAQELRARRGAKIISNDDEGAVLKGEGSHPASWTVETEDRQCSPGKRP